jgi:alginate O-acetyltransferase complex protein AlgI
MLFNSIDFAIFIAIFFLLYWFAAQKNLRFQNILLLVACYFFYAWWDWRFLSLLIASSLLNYYLGIQIAKSTNDKRRSILVGTGLVQGIGMLFFFKYYNFFITSFQNAFSIINVHFSIHTLQLILPLGISFYTFRTISYILDINNEEIKPTTNWVAFFTYVAFFPSLISGPIDRAKLLIPQLEKKRTFDYNQVTDGMRQILWGLFKKLVVADNCAVITNQVFDNYATLPASSLVMGAMFYSFQVYADFSGYSDMAIGVARLLGFNITKNFNFPFFAQNIAEFWQRWHISLTSWMTDYVYTPLSFIFRKYKKAGMIMAITINFVLVGLWHGANWTFIVFGFVQACYFTPLIIRGKMNIGTKLEAGKLFPSLVQFRNMLITFILVTVANIIFRSNSVWHALDYYKHIFSASIFSYPVLGSKIGALTLSVAVIFSFFVLCIEWLGKDKGYGLAILTQRFSKPVRWFLYYLIAMVIFLFAGKDQQFIYIQF